MTAALLVQIAAKATLVLLVGFGLTRAMARASAASRHMVWVLALGAALAVPAMHLAGPAWTLAVLPEVPEQVAEQPAELAGAVGTGPAQPIPDAATAAFTAVVEPPIFEPAEVGVSGDAPVAPAAPVNWGEIVVTVWLAGVVLMLLRLGVGVVWASLTVSRSDDLPHTEWLDSLDVAAAALGLTRPVALRVSTNAAVPMATGLWRAVVLLPMSAIDWPEERRLVVLQHELAHVKRRDCLIQALAQCVCAIHWFNPFAHMAVARLRAEQERACDDLVLQVGTDARSYADHLFEIARSFRATAFPTWVAMSMARPSQLEGRMLAILDSARARCAPSATLRATLLVGTMAVALPFGALRLGAQTPSAGPDWAPPGDLQAAAAALGGSSDNAAVDDNRPAEVVQALRPQVEVVRGDLADVDLVAPTPALRFGDAVQAGVFIHEAFAGADTLTGLAFKDATKGSSRVFAQAGPSGQSAAPVSDETRKRVADALISALNDDNPQVRQEALSALASMRDERAVPGLIRALSDPAVEVRMRAIAALTQFNSAAAADGMLTALRDRNVDVRQQAARGLASQVSRGQLRDQKYVDAISALLKDEDAEVREQAVATLGRMRVPAAAGPLTQALRDNSPDVREQAARALGQLGSADAVPSLTPLLKDPVTDVREQAARALGDIADPRGIDALTAALKDADAGVREEAARALGQIARGQRRGIRPGTPGVPVPPPVIALPPRAFAIDEERAREIAERAQAMAERVQRDVERRMRDLDRFDRFDVAPPPLPDPAPAPAPPSPPAPPR